MAHAKLPEAEKKKSFSARSIIKLKNKQKIAVGHKYEVTMVRQGNGLLESLEGTAKKQRFDVIGNRELP